jgi:hypothetical protein
MSAPAVPLPSIEALHAVFLTQLLPRLRRHGRIYFRDVHDSDRKEDLLCEMAALGWHWFVRLAERGKDATQFPSALASYAARAVRAGRRVTGQERLTDVLSKVAQQHHGFRVEALPCRMRRPFDEIHTAVGGQRQLDAYEEVLHDNAVTPVPDQVAFRVDFRDWRRTRTYRDRLIMEALILGDRTCDVSKRFGLTPGRVSQLRKEFRDDWALFTGDLPAPDQGRNGA